MKPTDEMTEKEKLEEEIAELKTRIKNTEYDLTHMFKNNSLLEQKLEISKKSLEEKQRLIEAISSSGNEEEKKISDEIIEEEKEILPKEQKDRIEEELDKEINS